MKTWIIALGFLTLNWNLQAAEFGERDTKCRLEISNIKLNANFEQQLKEDLLSGIWTKTTETTQGIKLATSWQFDASGLVSILKQCRSGVEKFDNRIWHIKVVEEQAFLIFTNTAAQEEKTFQVKQTCEGLNLTNMFTNETSTLLYTPSRLAKQLKTTSNTLIGTWRCLIPPENMPNVKGLFTQYELKADGTLVKMFGTQQMKTIEQSGFWQVSPNGQYLMMHIGSDNQYTTAIAKINYLAFDELVLGQSVATSEPEATYCSDLQSFYFHKQ